MVPPKESPMADLKIRVYKHGETEPDVTVTIPAGVIKVASKLIPKGAAESLQEKGIDIDELVRLSADPEVHGTLVVVEEHKKDERVVVSLE
jgi:hypothetical protein